MSLELDPILEETLHDVNSSINNITTQEDFPAFLNIFIAIYADASQWLENVRLPSTLERASLIISKLNKIEEDFILKMQTISQSKKQDDIECAHRFISTLIIEKLNCFKEAINKQKNEVQKLIKSKANYKDIELNEELLAQMIDKARDLLTSLKQKHIDAEKLEEFIHLHESHEKLLVPIKQNLHSFITQSGFTPSDSFIDCMIKTLKKDNSLDYAKKMGRIWKTAKVKSEIERNDFIKHAIDSFISDNQKPLNKLITQCLIISVSDNIQMVKHQIKNIIDGEYEHVPLEIRQTFHIFQNGIYYSAEWECNQLLADLHLRQQSACSVQKALDQLQQKWQNPQYVKELFCLILEHDWNINHSPQFSLFEHYRGLLHK